MLSNALATEVNKEVITIPVNKHTYTTSSGDIIIPRQVEEVGTNDLWVGETAVFQEGNDGLAMKTTIDTDGYVENVLHIIEKPTKKIISVGTKTPTIDNLPKINKPGGEGLTETAMKIRGIIFAKFPEVKEIGGYRAEDGYGEHSTGRALDIMTPSSEVGNRINDYLIGLHNDGVINLCWNIWEQKWYSAMDNFNPSGMEDRGGVTVNHYDHIHAFIADSSGTCNKNQ